MFIVKRVDGTRYGCIVSIYNKIELFSRLGEIVYIQLYMINNKGPRIDPCGTPIVKEYTSIIY